MWEGLEQEPGELSGLLQQVAQGQEIPEERVGPGPEDRGGEVTAKVQGSSRRPYSLDVGKRAVSEGRKGPIARECVGKV